MEIPNAGLEAALENLKEVVHGMNHPVIVGQLEEV
jgi:hypothetical protein